MRRVKEDRNKDSKQTTGKTEVNEQKKNNKQTKKLLFYLPFCIFSFTRKRQIPLNNANLAFHLSNFGISISRKIVTIPLHFPSFSSVAVITKPLHLHFHFEFTIFTDHNAPCLPHLPPPRHSR